MNQYDYFSGDIPGMRTENQTDFALLDAASMNPENK